MSVATLGGYYLVNSQAVRWTSTPGPNPDVAVYELYRADGERLWRKAGSGTPVDLRLADGDRDRIIKGLHLLRPVPASRPELAAYEVADLRWAWQRAWVVGRYNVRRRSGDRRIVYRDVLGNAAVADDVAYHPASLNPPFGGTERWTGGLIVGDVLRQIREQVPETWAFEYELGDVDEAVRPEGVELDDPGNVGLRRALAYTPGASIRVTDDAVVHVYSMVDGAEVASRANAGRPIREAPISIMADHSAVAPSRIDVLFTREPELRFDFLAQQPATTSGREERHLENVLPIPDQALDGYPPGTWVTFDKAFELWGNMPTAGGPLSHAIIQRQYLNPFWRSSQMNMVSIAAAEAGVNDDWMRRIAAVYRHYFRTFRLPRRWMDRILELRDRRVALLDPETGAFAPAQAWMDFAIRYDGQSPRTQAAARTAGMLLLARNIDGYAAGLGDGLVSPAEVRVIDGHEGIIDVTVNADPYGWGMSTVPCALKNIPTAQIGDVAGRPRFWSEQRGPQAALPMLTDNHRMAVVLSAVPAYPVGLQQLQSVRVRPADLLSDFPDLMRDVPLDAGGPVWTIRVPPSLETARIAWQDAAAYSIENCFGLGQQSPDSLNSSLEGYVTNGEAMKAVARTAAAVVYAGFRNRPLGSHVEYLSREAILQGGIGQLIHVIARGQSTTESRYVSNLPERDLLSFLPESVAVAVRRLVK